MSANQSTTAGTGASLTSAPDAAHHSESTPMNNTPLTWEGARAPFAKAFIAAQKATEAVKKASTNPAFKSRYADLAVVVEAVIPALNESGIAVIQSPSFDGDLVSVTTVLLHESGSSVTGTLSMRPTKMDPQGVGSAITYARRYALLAMAGAAPEDDDGQAASQPGPKNPTINVHPEGPDWWGAEGFGMSVAAAKKEGWGETLDAWLGDIPNIPTAEKWKAWCADEAADIKRLPKGWRVMLREAAEERGAELGAIQSTTPKAAA